MKKYTRELKKINKFLEEAKSILNDHTHCGDQENYIAVNVKRYNDYIDVYDIINNMQISKDKIEFLKNQFSDDRINNIYYSWLRMGANYFTDDVMNGCRNSSAEYWNSEIEKIKQNEKSIYPHIANIEKTENKIKEIEKWKKRDIKELNYLSILDNELEGFFGRSSGWLGIKKAEILQDKIDEIEYILSKCLNADNNIIINDQDEMDGYIEDCLYHADHELIKALNWIIKEIDIFNKGLDFKNEIDFRIDEVLNDNPFIEDVSSMYYAIN